MILGEFLISWNSITARRAWFEELAKSRSAMFKGLKKSEIDEMERIYTQIGEVFSMGFVTSSRGPG